MQTTCLYVIWTKNFFSYEVQTICLHLVQTTYLCLYSVYKNCLHLIYKEKFCLYYVQKIRLLMIQTQSNFLLKIGSLYYTVYFFLWVALMVTLGTLSPPLLLLFCLFGFIVTQALIYICFLIAPMIANCPDKVFLLVVVTNNTVVEPHFNYGVSCR